MIFFRLYTAWLSDTQQLKNGNLIFFSITEPYRDNLKPRFLIKSGYYIVPSLSTDLLHVYNGTRPLLWYAYRLIFLSAQWNAFLFSSGPVEGLEIWGEQVKAI